MPYSESTLPSDEDEDITHTLFEKETTIKKAEQSHDLSSQAEEDEEAAEDDITLPNQAKIINSSISESNILKHLRRALLAAHKQTKILLNSAKNLATRALLTALALVVVTPNNHNQAMKSEENIKWKEAETKEYKNMDKHKAWLDRPRRDDDDPIPSTWAFRKKLGSNNEVTEFKARICAQGFRQTFGLNFHAKYAPTGRPVSLRMLISFAINQNLKIHQLDVRSAFLTCPLEDKVTMLPPPGYEGPSGNIFELHKAVYGLRQAPLVWYKRLSNFLKSIGFKVSVSDPCVYWRGESSGKPMTWIYGHVDDLAIISKDPLVFKAEIEKEFDIKYLGEAEFLLGMKIN